MQKTPFLAYVFIRCISSKMAGGKYLKAEIVRKKGKNMLNDPIFNKGLAFPRAERDRLDIRGRSS
jgi:hypothetical protein